MRGPVILALAALLAAAPPAAASLSRTTLAGAAAVPAPSAVVPLDLPLTDLHENPVTLGAALGGRPALLMLADYRCTQLCGSILAIAADALHGAGLSPSADFSLAVVGFNPDADARDGATMRDQELAAYPDLKADAHLLTGTPEAIARLEQDLGFTAVRDAEAGRYAHPADLYVLMTDGRVSRVLNGLALDPDTLRRALVEAGQGRIGSLVDRLHVLCYGLEPLTGASTRVAQTMLQVGASLMLVCGGGLLAYAIRRRAFAARRKS